MHQSDLLLVPPAPQFDEARFESFPYPGLTPRESAQSALAQSPEFKAAIAAVIQSGPAVVVESQVRAAIPKDWEAALGRFCHAHLCQREADAYGIDVKYVSHGGSGGHHWEYRVRGARP